MVRAMYVGDLATAQAAMQPISGMPGCVTQFEDFGLYWPMIQKLLGWEPSIRLRDGMAKTYAWIHDEYMAKYGAQVGAG